VSDGDDLSCPREAPLIDKTRSTRRAMNPVSVATFLDCIEQQYRIRVFRRPCLRVLEVDLRALVKAGLANQTFIGRTWRCRQGGKPGHLIVWPPGF
jgi:hypothetical protein